MATPLLDVCGRTTVSSNSIEWYTWPGGYPAAPVVPEGTAKPEIDFPPTPHQAGLQTYAHHKPLSRQALEDVPQIRSIIEGALRGGVLRALEAAIIAAVAAGAAGAPPEVPTVDAGDMLTSTRLGLATVQTAGYSVANAVIMNPLDFAAMDIRVMEETVTGPNVTTRLWGLPVIVSADLPQGEAYVGDFQTGVTLFARNAMSVFMSDSHADYFVKNLLVILAEQRALAAVTAGGALCKCTATIAPLSAGATAGEKK
jgi:HK97 family phage major capsid protein